MATFSMKTRLFLDIGKYFIGIEISTAITFTENILTEQSAML